MYKIQLYDCLARIIVERTSVEFKRMNSDCILSWEIDCLGQSFDFIRCVTVNCELMHANKK